MPDVVENAIKPSMRIIRVSKARDERQSPMLFQWPFRSIRSRRRAAPRRSMRNPDVSVFNAVFHKWVEVSRASTRDLVNPRKCGFF